MVVYYPRRVVRKPNHLVSSLQLHEVFVSRIRLQVRDPALSVRKAALGAMTALSSSW